jgi:carboxyl-terminal processing protease
MESPGPTLPLGVMTALPQGASLDENGRIQADSNASMVGEVAPTVRVPLDEETQARVTAGENVQLIYAVDWIEAQAEEGAAGSSAVPTQRAAHVWAVVLAALAVLAVYLGRR